MLTIPPTSFWFKASFNNERWLNVILKPNNMAINIIIDTIPKPPISIKIDKITLPKILKCSAKLLTGVNPVTHIAEVDKNKESIYDNLLSVWDIGNHNKNDPIKITIKNDKKIKMNGERRILFFNFLFMFSPK